MRYYELTVTSGTSGQNFLLSPSGLGFTMGTGPLISSLYNAQQTSNSKLIGLTNPAALNIEFDLPIGPADVTQGTSAAVLRIWGLGLRCLTQAANLNPVNGVFNRFSLRAGMSRGLPLATASQAGLITSGIIWQAFGNWEGTEQTLDLMLFTGPGALNGGVPISWNWLRGTNLQAALAQMFAQAFPSYAPVITISPLLLAPSSQVGPYRDITAFFKYLKDYTRWLGAQSYGESYPGVSVTFLGNTIRASDGQGSAAPRTIQLAFQDLIGQPTWMAANQITFKTTLRADIQFADQVAFPTGVLPPYALTTPAAAYPNSPAASSSSFNGTFLVNQELHHYGNFRQSDAASWNTTYVSTFMPKGTPS